MMETPPLLVTPSSFLAIGASALMEGRELRNSPYKSLKSWCDKAYATVH